MARKKRLPRDLKAVRELAQQAFDAEPRDAVLLELERDTLIMRMGLRPWSKCLEGMPGLGSDYSMH